MSAPDFCQACGLDLSSWTVPFYQVENVDNYYKDTVKMTSIRSFVYYCEKCYEQKGKS